MKVDSLGLCRGLLLFSALVFHPAAGQLVGNGSAWVLDGSLFASGDPFIAAYGNEPTVCRDEAGNVVTCKQVNILNGIFMNAGPVHVSFAIHNGLHIAAHYINKDQLLLPGYEIVLHSRDTGWSATVKDKLVGDELLNATAAGRGYAGTISSFNLDGGYIYLFNKIGMPLLTGSISQQIVNTDEMPGGLSSVSHGGLAFPAILKVLQKCSYSHLGLIVDPVQFEYEANYFQTQIVAAGYSVDFVSELTDASDVSGVITNIKSSRTRVVMMFGEALPVVYLSCQLMLQNMSRVLVMHWPSVPWFLNAADAQDSRCYNPNTLLEQMKNNYIGFYPMTMDGSPPTKPMTCHPNTARNELQDEIVGYMTTTLAAAGASFGAVAHLAGGADLVCLMALYLQHMLINSSYTVEDIAPPTYVIYQEYLDWSWPDFYGFAGEMSFGKYYGSNGVFSGGRKAMIEVIQITGNDFLKSPYAGAGPPWDVGMIYPNFEELSDGSLVDSFVDALTFESGSECPANEFEECGVGEELLLGECTQCGIGRYLDSSTGECAYCAAGTYQASTGQTQCLPCDLGTFTSTSGLSSCETCPAGSHRPSGTSATSCIVCSAGSYSDEAQRSSEEGMASCTLCPIATYASSLESTACTACPEGLTTEERGASSADACVCAEGTYLGSDAGCHTCPEGMSCPVGSILDDSAAVRPTLLAGYWSSAEEPMAVYNCATETQCPGGYPGEACGPNLISRACAHCDDGYILSDGHCEECSPFETSAAFFPLLPIFLSPLVAVGMYIISGTDVHRWKHWHSGLAGLGFVLLNHYQMLVLMQVDEAPDAISGVIGFWSFTSDVLAVFKPPCMGLSNFMQSMTIKCLAPVGGAIFFIGVALTSRVVSSISGKPELAMKSHRVFCSYFTVIFTFFSAIAQVCFAVTKCSSNPSGKSTLIADKSVICFEGEWFSMLVIGCLAILFWCIGFGTLFIRAIVVAHSYWEDQTFRIRWKFLFIKFRPGCYFFSIVIVLKGIMTNVGFIIFENVLLQVYWTVGCLAIYCFVVACYMPWRIIQINFVDVCAHLSLICLGFMMTWFIPRSSESDDVVNWLSVMVSFFTAVICFAGSTHMIAAQTLRSWKLHHTQKAHEAREGVLVLAGMEHEDFHLLLTDLIDHDRNAFDTVVKAIPARAKSSSSLSGVGLGTGTATTVAAGGKSLSGGQSLSSTDVPEVSSKSPAPPPTYEMVI